MSDKKDTNDLCNEDREICAFKDGSCKRPGPWCCAKHGYFVYNGDSDKDTGKTWGPVHYTDIRSCGSQTNDTLVIAIDTGKLTISFPSRRKLFEFYRDLSAWYAIMTQFQKQLPWPNE